MEDQNNPEKLDLDFLRHETVIESFADLTIELMSGRHIQAEQYKLFRLLNQYFADLQNFYRIYYRLNLVEEAKDSVVYYYLSFFDDDWGKLGEASRRRALTEHQTLTAIMLLNMYYSKLFERNKVVSWASIRQEIVEGEFRADYQQVLFGEVRDWYTDVEWNRVERSFKDTIQSFEQLGWVKRHSLQKEDLLFELNESIRRFEQLYKQEIEDFKNFSLRVKVWNE